MLTLSDEQEAMELYEFAHKIGPANPNYAGFDRLMFLEMLFFREISRWDEATLNANSFIALFPKSPYTARMGGKDGRTEDEAALEYANATKPFQANDYKKSYTLFEQFLENYPNNWRHDIAQYRSIFSLYWLAARENPDNYINVINDINKVIDGNSVSIYIDDLMPLLIGTYIRIGNKKEARKALDFAKVNYSDSTQKEEFDHLWMDTYFSSTVYDKEEIKEYPELKNICYDRSIKYIEEGNYKRASKYALYYLKYMDTVDDNNIDANIENLKNNALQYSKQTHDWIELTEADYYWEANKRDKSIEVYHKLLDTNPEPDIHRQCVDKILIYMSSKGKSFEKLKEFKNKYKTEDIK